MVENWEGERGQNIASMADEKTDSLIQLYLYKSNAEVRR